MDEKLIAEATAMWRAGNPGNDECEPKTGDLLQWFMSEVIAERERSIAEQDKFAVDISNALIVVHGCRVRAQTAIEDIHAATAGVLKVIDDAVIRLYPGMDKKILAARGLHIAPKAPAEVVQMPEPHGNGEID